MGCLKALSFVFEYVCPQSAYYCDSVVTMLEDALTDRDLVHRQMASTIVKHLALGVAGLGCEDSMIHLMNLVWPNCFNTPPHVIGAVMDAIKAMRVTLGPGVLLSYVLQGLFHPARKVREVSNLSVISNVPKLIFFTRFISGFTMPCILVLKMPWFHSTLTSPNSAKGRMYMTDIHYKCLSKFRRRRYPLSTEPILFPLLLRGTGLSIMYKCNSRRC
jgi:hypothetical protein